MSKEEKSSLPLSRTSSQNLDSIKDALNHEKEALKATERLLKDKSEELYAASMQLKQVNARLQALFGKRSARVEGIFLSVADPFIVIDLNSRFINMNDSAKDFLGFDHTEEKVYLNSLVHQDYKKYTTESFRTLLEKGTVKDYIAKIVTRTHGERYVGINPSLIYGESGKPVAIQGVLRDMTHEMDLAKQLAEQKTWLNAIMESSPFGILSMERGKIVKANPAFIDLIGFSKEELMHKTLDDISTIEDISLYEDILKDDLKGDTDTVSIIRKYHPKNGISIWGKTTTKTLDKQRASVKVVLVEDITQEKLSEEQLRLAEQRLSTLAGNLSTGVLLEDEHGKVLLANQKFCDLFGISIRPEKLYGLTYVDYMDNYRSLFSTPEAVVQRTQEILLKKESVLSDRLKMANGKTYERNYAPLIIDDIHKGHLWTYTDVSAPPPPRDTMEKKVVREEKYTDIIDKMNLGLVEIDGEGTIVLANSRYAEMQGIPQEELPGKNILKLMDLDRESLIRMTEQFEKRKADQSASYEIEVTLPTGERRHWLISGTPRYDDTGAIIGSIGVLFDLTKQKELELQKHKLVKELEDSNKGLQEYAHIVSHDLKSPLRSITALATWIYEDYIDVLDEQGKFNLKMMMNKVEGMDKLIDGILKYSMVKSDVLDTAQVDVNEVVREITQIIFIPEHVRVNIIGELPVIQADKVKIHQVFQNFLSNAVVHIEKEVGVVEIASQETATHWQFSISDNGVGIPKEYHEKIFQIFQSIGNNENSTGIGLSIVKKIVDRYQGKVWLESEIGVGTTFYFTIKKQL